MTIVSVVMLVAGSLSVVFGASSVLDSGDVTADVDSEMRFYAVWYVVAGAFLMRSTRRVEAETWTIRWVAARFSSRDAAASCHGSSSAAPTCPSNAHGDRADTAAGCDPVAGFGRTASDNRRKLRTRGRARGEFG